MLLSALSNIRLLCPELASYVINSYRKPARLFVSNGDKEILSEEGVTQGDNAAMGFYACATIPVIAASRKPSSPEEAEEKKRRMILPRTRKQKQMHPA